MFPTFTAGEKGAMIFASEGRNCGAWASPSAGASKMIAAEISRRIELPHEKLLACVWSRWSVSGVVLLESKNTQSSVHNCKLPFTDSRQKTPDSDSEKFMQQRMK